MDSKEKKLWNRDSLCIVHIQLDSEAKFFDTFYIFRSRNGTDSLNHDTFHVVRNAHYFSDITMCVIKTQMSERSTIFIWRADDKTCEK